MGAISITGKSMGATSLKLTAGKITKPCPSPYYPVTCSPMGQREQRTDRHRQQ